MYKYEIVNTQKKIVQKRNAHGKKEGKIVFFFVAHTTFLSLHALTGRFRSTLGGSLDADNKVQIEITYKDEQL